MQLIFSKSTWILLTCSKMAKPMFNCLEPWYVEWTCSISSPHSWCNRITETWRGQTEWTVAWIIIHVYCSCSGIYLFKKKFKNFQKNSFQKIVVFSNIFLPIFHYIGLYIYTVKYNSGIKIPGFLRNIFKKKFQKIFKKEKKYFIAYGQILNFFQAYLHKNKNCIFFMFKNKIQKWIS